MWNTNCVIKLKKVIWEDILIRYNIKESGITSDIKIKVF